MSADDLGEIMRAMGFRPTEEELKDLLAEIDEDGSGEIEFAEFTQLCATFLVEDPDMETMKRELKDAFRWESIPEILIFPCITSDYIAEFTTKKALATSQQKL